MKKLSFILIGILVVILALAFFKDMIIKTSIEKGVGIVTGLGLKMQKFKVGIIKTVVEIKDFQVFNPSGYKDRIMLDIPEIYVDYDLPAILKGKVHLEKMRIDMKEFVVVKNEKGELNLDSLKVVQAQKEGKKPEEKEKGKVPEILIDSLALRIGKVVYKDYSRRGTPSIKEFNINLDEKYENITDPYSLVSLIVVKALMNTTIASLANFDLKGLKGTVSDALATAQGFTTEVTTKAAEELKETTQKAREVVKENTQKTQETLTKTTESLKKTTEGLKDAIELPFGSKEE